MDPSLNCADLGDVTKLVKETVAWRKGLNIALWDQEVMTIGYHDFVEDWQTLLNMFDLNPGERWDEKLTSNYSSSIQKI